MDTQRSFTLSDQPGPGGASSPEPAVEVGARAPGLVWLAVAMLVAAGGLYLLPTGPASGDGTTCGSLASPNFGDWSVDGLYDTLTSDTSGSGRCATVYGTTALTIAVLVTGAAVTVAGAVAGRARVSYTLGAGVVGAAAVVLALWAGFGVAAVLDGQGSYAAVARWVSGGTAVACAIAALGLKALD